MTGTHPESRDKLIEYFTNLQHTLERFDTFKPDAFGFACTSSSYLVDADEERRTFDSLQERFGYPIISCCRAILDGLRHVDAQSICLICPYPDWLMMESARYWKRNGLKVLATHSANPNASDTREVYDLDVGAFVQQMLHLVSDTEADVILIAGTGLPSLAAIRDMSAATGKTILSSNLCLAWRLLTEVGLSPDHNGENPSFPLLDGWQQRLDAPSSD